MGLFRIWHHWRLHITGTVSLYIFQIGTRLLTRRGNAGAPLFDECHPCSRSPALPKTADRSPLGDDESAPPPPTGDAEQSHQPRGAFPPKKERVPGSSSASTESNEGEGEQLLVNKEFETPKSRERVLDIVSSLLAGRSLEEAMGIDVGEVWSHGIGLIITSQKSPLHQVLSKGDLTCIPPQSLL